MAEPAYSAIHLKEALAADARVGELGLQVDLRGQEVFVSGTVSTAERRSAVEEVIGELMPEAVIHNATTVPPLDEPGDGDREHLPCSGWPPSAMSTWAGTRPVPSPPT